MLEFLMFFYLSYLLYVSHYKKLTKKAPKGNPKGAFVLPMLIPLELAEIPQTWYAPERTSLLVYNQQGILLILLFGSLLL
jgi:hypothetical protein